MKDCKMWSQAFLSLYMQGSLLRSICYPLIHEDPSWKETLDSQMNIHKKEFDEINAVMKQKLERLKNDALENGAKARPEWLKVEGNWDNQGWRLMNKTYWYMNDNVH